MKGKIAVSNIYIIGEGLAQYGKPVVGYIKGKKDSNFQLVTYVIEATGGKESITEVRENGYSKSSDLCYIMPVIKIKIIQEEVFLNYKKEFQLIKHIRNRNRDPYTFIRKFVKGLNIESNILNLPLEYSNSYVNFKINNDILNIIKESKTVILHVSYKDDLYVSSIGMSLDSKYTEFAFFKGVINKYTESKIKYSTNLEFGISAPQRQADLDNMAIDSDAWGATTSDERFRIPKYTPFRICAACGDTNGPFTKEHCTPKWLCAVEGKAEPVVAKILCSTCNGYFGSCYERPVQEKYEELTPEEFYKWIVLDKENIFSKWAIKTALNLAIATNKPVDTKWLKNLRNNSIPEGFRVYFGNYHSKYKKYLYLTSTLGNKQKDSFLLTFISGGIIFVVVKDDGYNNLRIPLNEIYPTHKNLAASPMPFMDITAIHDDLIFQLTGEKIINSQSFYSNIKME